MQLKKFLNRLKSPSVMLSLISHIVALMLLLGFKVNESYVLAISTSVCSILTILGIMSNPDTDTRGYGDDVFECSHCGKKTTHVKVNGQMVCKDCGAVCTSKD